MRVMSIIFALWYVKYAIQMDAYYINTTAVTMSKYCPKGFSYKLIYIRVNNKYIII